MGRTNIDLNDKILKEAIRLTHKKTRKEAVNYALEELVRAAKKADSRIRG